MSSSEKKKGTGTQATKYLVSTWDNFFIKKYYVTRKFHVLVVQNGIVVLQNNGKEMYKKVCCTYEFGFFTN